MKNPFSNFDLNEFIASLKSKGTEYLEITESFIFSPKFESILDSLLFYKNINPDTNLQQRDRIKNKLIQVLRAYETEITMGLSAVVLPAKYLKFIFIALIAYEFLNAKKNAPQAENAT